MGYIDLHVHSNASDGTMSPAEIVSLAKSVSLTAIALTDHDTISGIPSAQTAAKSSSLELIPGIELSCQYNGKEIHILGLYIDPSSPVLTDALKALHTIRDNRNQEILTQLQFHGMDITWDDLKTSCPDTVITRAHFAKALMEKHYVSTIKQAFDRFLGEGASCFPPRKGISSREAMELLTACHASPVLAHPCLYHMGDKELEELVFQLKAQGLHGIEVYHSSHNQYQSGKLKDMARKLGLLPTGGSDFHGLNKPDIQLGFGRGGLRVSDLLLDDLKNFRIKTGLQI